MVDASRDRGLVRALGATSVVLGVLAGALIAKIVSDGRRPRNDDTDGRGAPAALEPSAETELRANIARLERRVSVLAAETRTREPQPAAGPAEPARAAASPEPAKPLGLIEQREQAARTLQAMYDNLDRRLDTEPPDPAWRPEADLAAALKSLPAPPTGVSVRCAAAFCRVELVRNPAAGREEIATQIATLPVFSEGTTYRQDPDDPARLTLYVQRPGHLLAEDRP